MKIAIYGYGNLGRGVEAAMRQNPDVELIGVFSRRDPATVKTRTGTPVYAAADILNFKDKIDVLILCGGSATDLPELTPALAKDFCVVDSFDTHANIPQHLAAVDAAAKAAGIQTPFFQQRAGSSFWTKSACLSIICALPQFVKAELPVSTFGGRRHRFPVHFR